MSGAALVRDRSVSVWGHVSHSAWSLTQEEYDAATKLAASGENTGIKALPQDKQLKPYGWFKQVKEGDNTTAAPGMMSMPGSKVKWEAWEACKGMSKEAAMKAYVDAINEWKS